MRRKVLALILSICMAVTLLSGIPLDAHAAGETGVLRVKLSIGTVSSFSFYNDGNYSVSDTPLERQLYTVKLEGGKLNLYYGSRLVSSGSTIYITRHTGTTGYNNFIWLNNSLYGYRSYIGDMCFSISGSSLTLVNYIDIEHYLYGVVPYEMSDGWPIEALKAQAIAARNYAAKRLGGGGSYDITDTSSDDQVYKGFDASASNAIAAVDATAGKVLLSGSTVIDTYYSASNGGWTELPYHRWGGGATWPYYQITYDPFDLANPSSRYETITFPVAIDGAHPITTSTNVSGTIDTDKAVALIRQAIFASGQLSSYGVSSADGFALTGVLDLYAHTYDTSSGQDHSRMPASGVNDCIDKVMATGDFTVSVGGTLVTVNDVTFDMRGLCSSDGGKAFIYASLGVYYIEPVYDGSTITAFALSMRRYGHGCGLSQRGAQQRANSGQTYDQILQFYYPTTTLSTLSLTHPALTANVSPDYANATFVCSGSDNVRSSPSSSSSTNIVGTLPNGARIEVTDDFYSGGNWHQINYGGTAAYVYKDLVAFDTPQVPKHVSGVSLNTSAATLTPGGSMTLTATVSPATAVNRAVTWASDSAVVTVSGGVVTAVSEGTAHITVTTAEGGYQAVCTVTVKSDGITSAKYRIDATTVAGVLKNTDVVQFIAGLSNDAASLHVYKADGTELTSGIIGTGMTVAMFKDGVEVDRLTIIVKGDANGDGNVSISDYTLVRYEILDLKPLAGAYLTAGDVNGDGNVSISDYTLIRYDILGLKSIT